MDTVMDLGQVGPAFSDPVAASQSVFRAGLEALSKPGKLITIDSDACAPQGVQPAACALLLALLDQDTTLFVSPSHDAGTAAYFRFHTGCLLTGSTEDADFLLLGTRDPWPDLARLRIGSEYAPDHSATLVREVTALTGGRGIQLSGPGIPGSAAIEAEQLDADFVRQWRIARGLFPRGVDLLLTCGHEVCGLPRTVHIAAHIEVN